MGFINSYSNLNKFSILKQHFKNKQTNFLIFVCLIRIHYFLYFLSIISKYFGILTFIFQKNSVYANILYST